ncbi:hypothetical protein DSO57_1010077 [Entomophthora muscae]|uniref:Uncharacterized protein n=1 Tax=Entomophthora muscae TaxID=34485 RepID=A0ACC2SJQ8_9FUNG|nr:hypothetical protein DSO57_1010077 [Entomophthora muscae]
MGWRLMDPAPQIGRLFVELTSEEGRIDFGEVVGHISAFDKLFAVWLGGSFQTFEWFALLPNSVAVIGFLTGA